MPPQQDRVKCDRLGKIFPFGSLERHEPANPTQCMQWSSRFQTMSRGAEERYQIASIQLLLSMKAFHFPSYPERSRSTEWRKETRILYVRWEPRPFCVRSELFPLCG